MAGRNYKTGSRRTPRKSDPSTIKKRTQAVYPLAKLESTPGVGSLTLIVLPISPADGQTLASTVFRNTGLATKVYFRDNAGVSHPAQVSYNQGSSEWTLFWASGLAEGPGSPIVIDQDPAIRGKHGEWVGTYAGTETILG